MPVTNERLMQICNCEGDEPNHEELFAMAQELAAARGLTAMQLAFSAEPVHVPLPDESRDLRLAIHQAWIDYQGDKELSLDEAFTFASGFKAAYGQRAPDNVSSVPVAFADPMAFKHFKAGLDTKEWMWAKPDSGLIALYTAPYTDPYKLNMTRIYELARQAGYNRDTPTVRLAFQGFDFLKFVRLLSGQTG